jgi:hypothetical protein
MNLRLFDCYQLGIVPMALVRLNPASTPVNNQLFDDEQVALKCKFLDRFSYLIDELEEGQRKEIYLSHLHEAFTAVRDKESVKRLFSEKYLV